MSVSGTSSDEEPVLSESLEIHAPVDVMHLYELLGRFMCAQTPTEGRRILEQHPELLGDDAWFVADRLLEGARARGDAEAVFVLHERRVVLQRCREVGIAAAFSKLER